MMTHCVHFTGSPENQIWSFSMCPFTHSAHRRGEREFPNSTWSQMLEILSRFEVGGANASCSYRRIWCYTSDLILNRSSWKTSSWCLVNIPLLLHPHYLTSFLFCSCSGGSPAAFTIEANLSCFQIDMVMIVVLLRSGVSESQCFLANQSVFIPV